MAWEPNIIGIIKMPLPEGGKSLGMLSMLYSQLSEEHDKRNEYF